MFLGVFVDMKVQVKVCRRKSLFEFLKMSSWIALCARSLVVCTCTYTCMCFTSSIGCVAMVRVESARVGMFRSLTRKTNAHPASENHPI